MIGMHLASLTVLYSTAESPSLAGPPKHQMVWSPVPFGQRRSVLVEGGWMMDEGRRWLDASEESCKHTPRERPASGKPRKIDASLIEQK